MKSDEVNAHEPVGILDPAGRPARLPRTAKCPQCGAGPARRVRSGLGPTQFVTCDVCAYEFGTEPTRGDI